MTDFLGQTKRPGVYGQIDFSQARSTTGAREYFACIMGQKLSTGTALANMPYQVLNENEVKTLFGAGSVIHQIWLSFVGQAGDTFPVEIVAQADPVGSKAKFTVDYTASYSVASAKAGVESLFILGAQYDVAVAVGDTATDVASAMDDAINDNQDAIYVATSASGVLSIEFKHVGVVGNDLLGGIYHHDRGLITSPSGARPTIAQTVVGSGSPSVSDALAAVANKAYTHIYTHYINEANLELFNLDATERWEAFGSQYDYHVFVATRGSATDLINWIGSPLDSDRVINSKHINIIALPDSYTIAGVLLPNLTQASWVVGAAAMGEAMNRASKSRATANVKGILLCTGDLNLDYTNAEKEQLIANGLGYVVNASGDIKIGKLITTQVAEFGVLTDKYRNYETIAGASFVRWFFVQFIKQRHPQSNFSGTESRAAQEAVDVLTPHKLNALFMEGALILQNQLVIEDMQAFKQSLKSAGSTINCDRTNTDFVATLVKLADQISFNAGIRLC
jgi:phage tail sheath gpL-like